ncbi:ABC transporter ATP-binding protein [Paenibacillus sp. tmac-D7]|uniref:ABC transporter ATP-binding protein n=1 Tax=Paenibacillus sp. tmac-D7 TaxID=2591462 RepID=UPI00114273A1|nr:oligopeptide/dipeptide ABC transporter ATP-binding protein [Paenibacillus sp. tmac-D7]
MAPAEDIVQLQNIKKHYAGGFWGGQRQTLRAVDGVSLSIRAGETLGLVGESGCGKSTVGQLASLLLPATDGTLVYNGKDITGLSGPRARSMRRHMQYVFQDPYTSLNPRLRIGELLEEPLKINRLGDSRERKRQVDDMLLRIGLDPSYARHYTHQLSGGQRQRIGIARSLMLKPEFLVLDEPVSSLDVSVQSQILNLLKDLQRELNLTYLFISHDLNVVHYMSDRVAVMYLGKIVEIAEVEDLYANPLHPYTKALVSAIPSENRREKRERIILKGDMPSPLDIPKGCAFQTRCVHAHERCSTEAPVLTGIREGHFVSCHLYT